MLRRGGEVRLQLKKQQTNLVGRMDVALEAEVAQRVSAAAAAAVGPAWRLHAQQRRGPRVHPAQLSECRPREMFLGGQMPNPEKRMFVVGGEQKIAIFSPEF